MIDKIVITLSDSGFIQINVGDVHFIHTTNMVDVLLNVKEAISKLAYFPSNNPNDISHPITLEEFRKQHKTK